MPGRLWPGLPALRSSPTAEFLRSARDQLLHALSRPGCIFCREQAEALDRHFFWYLVEQYFEPSAIRRMQRSHGFCRRHTSHLLARGGPGTIGRIYLWMLPPYLAALRALETAELTAKSAPARLAALRPMAGCAACQAEAEAAERWLSPLRATLHDAEVRRALTAGFSLCLDHFLAIAPSLDWAQLRWTLEAVLGQVRLASPQRVCEDVPAWLSLVRGRDADARPRSAARRASRGQARIAGAADGQDGAPGVGTWSPTLARLHQLLAEPGCAVCHARHAGLWDYFQWLEREIMDTPSFRWHEALWLCRTHAWDFAHAGDGPARPKLVSAIVAYWRSQLEALAASLRDEPPRSLARRVETVPAHLRRIAAARGAPRPGLGALWRCLGPALRAALESPERRLADLRQVALRTSDCPACRHLRTIAARTCDLLARSLADPATASRYQQSSGVCFRDLPLALSACRDAEQVKALARAARVRLEVLQWELEEAMRKEDWSVRYEAKSTEQAAWERAVGQVSGAHPSDWTMLGLD